MAAPVWSSIAASATVIRTNLASATLATSTAVATLGATEQASNSPENNGECQLLGPFSLLIQGALGGLALLSLVYKRWKERPQRPLKIWAFDVSKQVFGSVMLHLANLLLSLFSAGHFEISQQYQPNPCSFYLLNLGIDTTLGIPILYLVLLIINQLALYTPLARPPESIESGNYGQPPNVMWWFKQAILYFLGLLWMKFSVFILIQVFPVIVKVGDWALRWTEGNAALQIIFVMLLFPLIMNAIQYYIVDTFIKRKLTLDDEGDRFGTEGSRNAIIDDERHRRALLGDDDSSIDEDSETEDVEVGKPRDLPTNMHGPEADDYGPIVDGGDSFPESSTSNHRLSQVKP
ncbi:Vacuolar membrane protein YPL162C [Talaromyces islandicus]|uniref:Vacuolar membrane protein YPL162C n=1 Tax=Talaromyces islandicus TaxID=28573 RepID=A0A0U1LQT9_TALIS|nr:Vacuolar membrane protein YPL162C [Talaromyces islandicus]